MAMFEIIKMLLGIPESDGDKDNVILYHLQSVTQLIKNYCNRPDLPEELESVVIDKVVKIMSEGDSLGAVKSLAIGDTTTQFDTTRTQDILDDVKSQLNKFKRVKSL